MPEIMEPLPAYSERFDEIDINHDGLDTKAKLTGMLISVVIEYDTDIMNR
jgi:hypothetical protein